MHIHTDANERAPDLVVHSNPGMSGTDHPNLYWTVTSRGLFFCLSQVHYPRINPFFLLSFFRFSHASALSYMHALINTLRVFVLPDRFRVMKSMWPNPTGRERERLSSPEVWPYVDQSWGFKRGHVLLSSVLLYLFNTDYLSTRPLIKHVPSSCCI